MKTLILNPNEIDKIIQALNNGKIIAFKTDTVYGFSCSSLCEDACKKIVEIKGRDKKPMILLIGKNIDYTNYVDSNSKKTNKIIENFWPGPLTIIFKTKYNFNEYITCGKDTIGVRMPKDELCEKILNNVNYPIVSTSANISGQPILLNKDEILKYFDGKVDIIVDSGKCESSLSSTIISIDNDNINVLREGQITKKEIDKKLEL